MMNKQKKIVTQVKVKNDLGIHTRPATHIVRLLHGCRSNVFFTYKRDTVNAKSILSLLMLAAQKNAKITITVDGDDAEETTKKLLHAFESSFGE